MAATPSLDCSCRPEEESSTLQPASEWVPAVLPWLRLSTDWLGMSACTLLGWGLGPPRTWGAVTSRQPPGLRLRSPQNPEEELPAGNLNTGLPLQTRGGVTNSTACLRMSACTPPGLRLRSPQNLRSSHHQAAPTLDFPCRPEEESSTLQPAWEWVPAPSWVEA